MKRAVGVAGVGVLVVGLVGCAADPLRLADPANAVCVLFDDATATATIGVLHTEARANVEITDVVPVDAENLEVVGWYVATAPEDFIGSAQGFDVPTGATQSYRADESGYVQVGFTLEEPTRDGHADAVRLEFDGGSLSQPTGIDVTLVPAGGSC
ncbi:hypothetical protein LG315_07900 [Microbacterium marinum]|uniref:hypothetical protein n=1 Tax=Microbacterium marinum TaxID=421115 RepID=UPI00384F14AF